MCRAHRRACATEVVQTGAGCAARFCGDGAPSGRQLVQGSPRSPTRLTPQGDRFCTLLRNKLPSLHGGAAQEQPRVGSD